MTNNSNTSVQNITNGNHTAKVVRIELFPNDSRISTIKYNGKYYTVSHDGRLTECDVEQICKFISFLGQNQYRGKKASESTSYITGAESWQAQKSDNTLVSIYHHTAWNTDQNTKRYLLLDLRPSEELELIKFRSNCL